MNTHKMNTMINTHASMIGLQFGSEKCVKIHVGKNHNTDICGQGKVDTWIDEIFKTEEGNEKVKDKYMGQVNMKTVQDKKYIGQIVSEDSKNDKNIKDKVINLLEMLIK